VGLPTTRCRCNLPSMPFTLQVLIGLVAGLLLGVGVDVSRAPWLLRVPSFVEPIGLVFINAIRMTVIPLVVSSLIVGVAANKDAKAIGRLGGRAIAWFLVALFAAALFSAVCAYPLLARLHIDPEVAATLRLNAAGASKAAMDNAGQLPSFGSWFVALVPVNVIKAGADGAMLPLILFSLAFGFALTRVEQGRREAVAGVFRGIAEAMLVIVGWVLKFAPLGVFALAVPLAARMGLAAAGALIYYIALLSLVSGAFIVLVLYPATVVLGRVSLGRFLRAAGPATAVAFTSRSSLAALPAAIEGARSGLGLPEEIPSFFLPLAASMFRVGAAMAQVVGVLFVARLYGVTLTGSQVATIIVTVVLTTFSVPGVPAGAIIVMAPVLAAASLPVEGIGLLLGVDTIPDMFRTAANVVGWLGVGSILGRTGRAGQVAGREGAAP
jgi:proton glutamate symport protein